MDMFFGEDGYYGGASFKRTYRCYPGSFVDKAQIENGDKVIMPASALDRLVSLHIDYPMLFELQNDSTGRVSHCGVLEFTAEEGTMYMPNWMMENLLLQEGDLVQVKNVALPKGTFMKLQPHTKDFLDISNPKAILENTLRNFSCLSIGDSIMVAYNSKKYYIDILETKPSNAISIIETDCEVDFAPPLDYKEPQKPVVSIPTGKSRAEGQEPPAEMGPKLNPFTGVARRLDGTSQLPTVTSNVRTDAPTATEQAAKSSSLGNNRLTQGKLVFGSNTNRSHEASKDTSKGTKQEPPKNEEPKFLAFSGKKYSLMD